MTKYHHTIELKSWQHIRELMAYPSSSDALKAAIDDSREKIATSCAAFRMAGLDDQAANVEELLQLAVIDVAEIVTPFATAPPHASKVLADLATLRLSFEGQSARLLTKLRAADFEQESAVIADALMHIVDTAIGEKTRAAKRERQMTFVWSALGVMLTVVVLL